MRMKYLIALLAGVFLFLILAGMASAQDQKKTSTREDRLGGTVHTIDKDTSSIIIRKGPVQRRVVYNAETKFTIQNKPRSIDDVIAGRSSALAASTTSPAYWLPKSRSARGRETHSG